MLRRPDARSVLVEKIRTSPPKFVHVIGVPYLVEREAAAEPERRDHIWITLEAPPFGRLRTVVNTFSRLNLRAGFDPRVRVGRVRSTWSEKPTPGLVEEPGQDYSLIETWTNIFYERYENVELAALLIARAERSIRVEVWGELYARDHLGVHQIHCRRASSAVPQDLKNRDGAMKLYYSEENSAELFLFKFSGQP